MCRPEDYVALAWPDERLKRASGGRKASHAFRDMDQLLARRGPIPAELWGEDPRRQQVARRVSAIIKHSIAWTTDYFLPNDPVDILLWGGWYDLAEVEALMEIEEQFAVDLTQREIDRIWNENVTLGQLVDLLLETSPCPVPWPLSGEESLESQPCPSRTAFVELRAFIQGRCRPQATRLRPSTELPSVLPSPDWPQVDRFVAARFGARGLIRKRFCGVTSPLWTWLAASSALAAVLGAAFSWQMTGWLGSSLFGLVVSGVFVARLSWPTWRRGRTTARQVVRWLLEQRWNSRPKDRNDGMVDLPSPPVYR